MSTAVKILAAIVVLGGAGVLVLRAPAVEDRILVAGVRHEVARKPPLLGSPDHLRVLICGTAPPPPSARRAKSCAVVMAGNHVFVVDTGPGSANKLSLWRFPMQRIEGVMLTHFHSDHIGDLGEFRMQSWVSGRAAPLAVFGPTGVEAIVAGVNQTYGADDSYRAGEHRLNRAAASLVARPFGLAEPGQRATHMADALVYDQDGLKITAFQVIHEPVYPAVGYRFDYKGRSVVFSGDTLASPNLVRHARGADVLIHEGQNEDERKVLVDALAHNGEGRLARVLSDVVSYHATPLEVAREANTAGVKLLVFNHMGPIPPDNLLTKRVFARGLDQIRPRVGWRLANDGATLDLPVGGEAIHWGTVR